jgi:tripartite-type tricarboxylate transporter receptor subunit TctC
MPGAGNLIALNHVSQQPPDGTTIGSFNGPGNTVTVMTDTADEELQFDLAEMSWLVGLTSEPRLMEVAADSPYQTLDDVLAADEEIVSGVTGTSGAGYNDAILFQEVFPDVQTRLVTGFESGAEAQLALIAGEVDVVFQLMGGELPAIEAGEIRGLLVLDEERAEALPDTPAIGEYELTEEQSALLDTHITISKLGIILVGPPGMDDATLSALQAVLLEAASDPELVAEQQERGIAWNPRDGETIREAVLAALNAPEEYVEMMREAVSQ